MHSSRTQPPLNHAQVCVTLPPHLTKTLHITGTGMPIALEVWAAGMLACSSTPIVLPPAHAAVVGELTSWVNELTASEGGLDAEACAVLDDMVAWARFQALQPKDKEQQEQEQQQQMAEIGNALLCFFQQRGLRAVEGERRMGKEKRRKEEKNGMMCA